MGFLNIEEGLMACTCRNYEDQIKYTVRHNKKKRRYRYILSGGVASTDNISYYRIFDKQKMQGESSVIRVDIPDDAILEKWDYDEYSTWDSKNKHDYKLLELNAKICIKINGRWKILQDATNEWLNGKNMKDAIQDSIKGKYYSVPKFNIGYVSKEQYTWMQKHYKYAWRFDKLPSDLDNVKIPPLTDLELSTLYFVREQFKRYYEEIIDDSDRFKDSERQDAKHFFKDLIDNMSNDDLAYEWHRQSTKSLDPKRKFETIQLVDKIQRSKYGYVHEEHYKYAVEEIIENMSIEFRAYLRSKQ